MAELKPGDWIAGEYRILRIFGGHGKSGMGIVYLVEGRSSEEPFILKTFQKSELNPNLFHRFKREAEIWVNLGKHPNIVFAHWVREFDNQLFIALEYVRPDLQKRNTLSQYLKGGAISLETTYAWIGQFCFAMKHAITRGLSAHRDIKPDNLMIGNDRRLKITDFGIAKSAGLDETVPSQILSHQESKNTIAGAILGTPAFMAPEQFIDSSAVDYRADIYSLGIIVYMLLSGGTLPINARIKNDSTADQFSAWMAAHINQPIRKLDSPLMAIAGKCLEKTSKNRFQSYDEILDLLNKTGQQLGLAELRDEIEADAQFLSEYAVAQSLNNLGDNMQSEVKLRQMAVRWPDKAVIYTELGKALIGMKRWDEALIVTEKSLSIYPNSTAAWNNLGGILGSLKRYNEARLAFANAVIIEPENSGALIALANLEMTCGNPDDAAKLCEQALFWRPSKVNVLQLSIEILMKCGKFVRAQEICRKFAAIDPSDARSWFNLALCYQVTGDIHGEISALEEVLLRNPNDGEALNFLVQALTNSQKIQEAIDACRRLQAIPKWEIVGACKEAQLLAGHGADLPAYLLLNRMLAKHDRNAQLWFTMAIDRVRFFAPGGVLVLGMS